MPDEKRPDWNAVVRERVNLTKLPPREQQEVVAELAAHLDDLCKQYHAQGLAESEAVTRAMQEVTDWHSLAKTIQRAKLEEGTMNDRTKRLWLPGLVSTAIALVLPILLLMALSREPMIMAYLRPGLMPIIWLLPAAFGGATGASLSRRAGAKPFARVASALFPVVVFVVAIGIVCGFIVVAPSFGAHQLAPRRELVRDILPTISVYSAALLLGALPFLRPSRSLESATLS